MDVAYSRCCIVTGVRSCQLPKLSWTDVDLFFGWGAGARCLVSGEPPPKSVVSGVVSQSRERPLSTPPFTSFRSEDNKSSLLVPLPTSNGVIEVEIDCLIRMRVKDLTALG